MMRFLSSFTRLMVVIFAYGLILAGCGGRGADNANSVSGDALDTITETPSASATSTRIPTGEPTILPTQTLSIWWPDILYPAESEVIDRQIRDFVDAQSVDIDVDFRRKRTQDVGGILSTLRSAVKVAPGALPDLVLIRRQDLISAYQDNLLSVMDGLVPGVVIGDVYDSALRLGQFDGQIYGLPYLVEVEHLAYPADSTLAFTDGIVNFDDLINSRVLLTFPAAQVSGLSDLFYLQYLGAGGLPPDSAGAFTPDRQALIDTLGFYEAAVDAGVVDSAVLDLNRISDYQVELVTGEFGIALIDSTTFLSLNSEAEKLRMAAVATESGDPIGIIGGWMWVVTTTDADQQAIVADFIAWMMNPGRQRELAATLNMLPSQQSVVQSMSGDINQILLFDNMLQNAYLPLTDANSGIFARAIQNALVAVISREMTAHDAVDTVIEPVAD